MVDASTQRRNVVKDFDGSQELEEKISAVECTCSGRGQWGSRGGQQQQQQQPRVGNSGPNCDPVR